MTVSASLQPFELHMGDDWNVPFTEAGDGAKYSAETVHSVDDVLMDRSSEMVVFERVNDQEVGSYNEMCWFTIFV